MGLTISDINCIIYWLHLTIGNILALSGIIGSLSIILVFLHPRLCQSTSSRYIIAGVVFDLIQIIDLALPRLFLYGFQIDILSKHQILCKLIFSCGTSTSLGPYFCLYMPLFDRWTKSSRNVHRRGLSNNRLAKKAIIIIITFCILLGIPNLYVFDIVTVNVTGQQVCIPTLFGYLRYYIYFINPVLTIGLPLIIISTFAILTSINISQLGGRRTASRLEKQLTWITIFQVLTVIVSSVPMCVQFIYSTVTISCSKDAFRLAQENLFLQITNISYYMVYVCPFYIYFCVSSEVRRSVKEVICRRRNRVEVIMNRPRPHP